MAGKPRVHEVAKELGIDSKAALRLLKGMGYFVKSPSSTIEPPVARKLRRAVKEGIAAPAAPRSRAEPVPLTSLSPTQKKAMPVPVLLPSFPASSNPEDIAAHRRREIIQRRETDWERFGFSDQDHRIWTQAGVPEDMAQIAAMCRDSVKRTDSQARLLPANLRQQLEDRHGRPQLVVEALMSGENTLRVEERLAVRMNAPVPSMATDLVRVLGGPQRISEPSLYGRCLAFAAMDWMPRNLPYVAEAALDVLSTIAPYLRTLLEFHGQLAQFRDSRTVSPLLAAFARAHGVFHADEHLSALVDTVLDRRREYAAALDVVAVAEKALDARHFSHLHSEVAQSIADSRGTTLDPDSMLPADAGVLVVDGPLAQIVFWASGPTGVHAFAISRDEVANMTPDAATSLGRGLEVWSTTGVRDGHSAAAVLLDALIAAREASLGRGTSRRKITEARTGKGRPEVKDIVVSYRALGPVNQTSSVGQGHKLNHRVRVAAHPRNQFYPSTREHRTIQIASYEKGPADAPLLISQKVIVY